MFQNSSVYLLFQHSILFINDLILWTPFTPDALRTCNNSGDYWMVNGDTARILHFAEQRMHLTLNLTPLLGIQGAPNSMLCQVMQVISTNLFTLFIVKIFRISC